MMQKFNFTIFISCILVVGLVLGGCGETPPLVSRPTLTSFQTPSQATATVVSTTVAIEATLTSSPKPIIIAPDNLFMFPGLKLPSTPDSTDFCEYLPSPQIGKGTNEVSLLVGRFSLCVSHSWPWLKTAMDLDTGTLVSLDHKGGDIAMDYTHPDLNGETSYFVYGLNNAHIDEIDATSLTYSNCEKLVLNLEDPGSFRVHEGGISCVLTTEGKLAVIRAEHIYPANTQAVEFSFAVLREQP